MDEKKLADGVAEAPQRPADQQTFQGNQRFAAGQDEPATPEAQADMPAAEVGGEQDAQAAEPAFAPVEEAPAAPAADEVPGEEAAKPTSMGLMVYNQFTRTAVSPEGERYTVYVGEDAYPYLSESFFAVADGLGGNGSSPHTLFNKGLFDQNRIVSALFDGVFSDLQDETFVKYVQTAFRELYAIKDHYTENKDNVKPTAYFGSRLVCAILIQAMLQNRQRFEGGGVFDELDRAQDKEKKLKELSDFFTDFVKTNLMKVSHKANLILEDTKNRGKKLFATTLCATICRETEDGVDALYLYAGDSRAYHWDATGLHQVIRDQEDASGGMTNCIQCGENAKFSIDCRYMHFDKPCILFNASDGCFDGFAFGLTPMLFEYFILHTIESTDSLEAAGEAMGKFFMRDGVRDDDSSTMAMRIYGYESLDAVKAAFRKRISEMEAYYLAEDPKILQGNYTKMYQNEQRNLRATRGAFRDRLFNDPSVQSYCEGVLDSDADFVRGLSPFVEERAACKEKKAGAGAALFDLLCRHIELVLRDVGMDEQGAAYIEQRYASMRRVGEQLADLAEQYKPCIHNLAEALLSALDAAADHARTGAAGTPVFALDRIEQLSGEAGLAYQTLSDWQDGKLALQKEIELYEKEIAAKRAALIKEYGEDLQRETVPQLLDGEIHPDSLSLSEEEKEEIRDQLSLVRSCEETARDIEKREHAYRGQALMAYWAAHGDAMTDRILREGDPRLCAEVQDGLAAYHTAAAKLEEARVKSEQQARILGYYMDQYTIYFDKAGDEA